MQIFSYKYQTEKLIPGKLTFSEIGGLDDQFNAYVSYGKIIHIGLCCALANVMQLGYNQHYIFRQPV